MSFQPTQTTVRIHICLQVTQISSSVTCHVLLSVSLSLKKEKVFIQTQLRWGCGDLLQGFLQGAAWTRKHHLTPSSASTGSPVAEADYCWLSCPWHQAINHHSDGLWLAFSLFKVTNWPLPLLFHAQCSYKNIWEWQGCPMQTEETNVYIMGTPSSQSKQD